jgi:hypothetical protein
MKTKYINNTYEINSLFILNIFINSIILSYV